MGKVVNRLTQCCRTRAMAAHNLTEHKLTRDWQQVVTEGASTRSYTKLFYLVLLYVYDLLSLVHVGTKVRVRVRVRRPPTMLDFCTSYTCTTYKCTSLLYSDELIIIAGVSNQMVFLQDITL